MNNDSLKNIYTGMGGPTDPVNGLYLSAPKKFSETSLDRLIRDFPLLRKIVEIFPDMMTARFGIPVFGGQEFDQELLEKLKTKLNRIRGYSCYNEYRGLADCANTLAKFANLYGNGAAIMLCDDSDDYSKPIDFANLENVGGLYLLNGFDIHPDLNNRAMLNQFTHFKLSRSNQIEQIKNNLVHKSRVLWFRGAELGAEELAGNNGRDDSILASILDSFFAYQTGVNSLSNMITNASQKRHGIKGLYDDMAEKGQEYETFIRERLRLNSLMGSVFNTLLFDPEKEEIDFLERSNLSDVNEAFNNVLTNLIASTKYTKSQLLGEFVGGILTAGSETEKQQINMAVLQEQRSKLHSPILKLLETIVRSGEFNRTKPDSVELDFKWLPYSLPTSSELATLKQTYVAMALNANSIDPKIAINMLLSFFRESEFSEEVNLDPTLIQALDNLIKTEAEALLAPPQLDPLTIDE